jgi:hypothetical protein
VRPTTDRQICASDIGVRDDVDVTEHYDPERFRPLSDAEKTTLAPDWAHRASVLFRRVTAGMIRQPHSDEERSLAIELAELYPEQYRLDQ